MRNQPRQIPRPGWSPTLIIDDAEFFSLLCEAKNSKQEIFFAAAVHPTGPDDKGRRSAGDKGALTRQFARPVYAQRTRGIGLKPRRISGSVKHVVGREM